jgi:hypothetical protein
MSKSDSIIRLPDDPKALEEYLKTLPPEVIEQFAASWQRKDKADEESEMGKNLFQIISRLARKSTEH